MKFNQSTNGTQQLRVIVKRSKGNQYFAGPNMGHPKAKDESDDIGLQIKNREGFYPLVASFPKEPQTVRFVDLMGNPVEVEVKEATCTVVISDEELRALNAHPGNAWSIQVDALVGLNTQDPNSKLYGSLWLEPVGELDATQLPGLVEDAATAQGAVNANAERNRETLMARAAERQLAQTARQASAKTPATK